MPANLSVRLRAADADDAEFIVEMARHASVIEDWPLPPPDDEEVLSLLPPQGEVPILAIDATGRRVGAVWTFHNDPPLRVDAAGVALPELCIAVTADMRGRGVGSTLLDALFERCTDSFDMLCMNVHVRHPARRLYERKGFRVSGHGRGPLGIAMVKNLR